MFGTLEKYAKKYSFLIVIILIIFIIIILNYVWELIFPADLFLVIVTFLLVLVTYFSWDTNKRNMWHQVLLNVQKEYRTVEMDYAIHTLWNFYRKECNENEKTLKDKYEKIYNYELEHLEELGKKAKKQKNPTEIIEYKKVTFDTQRRLVSHFYYHLEDIYKKGILPKDIVFDFWSHDTLMIIPYILIHLNDKLKEIIKGKEIKEYVPHKFDKTDRAMKLYNDSIDYYNKTRKN